MRMPVATRTAMPLNSLLHGRAPSRADAIATASTALSRRLVLGRRSAHLTLFVIPRRCGSVAKHTAGRRASTMAAAQPDEDLRGGKAGFASFNKAMQSQPGDLLGSPLIIGPPPSCQSPQSTQTLLVLAPGALIPAQDYIPLATALQAALNGRIRLTIAIVSIDWKAAGFSGFVMQKDFVTVAVEAAVAAAADHIQLKKSPAGRHEEVFVAGHSLMGVAAVRYALEKAAGLVLLGSAMLPKSSELFPTARTWTRPILQLSAELDGQQYLSKQAVSVLDAAESAAKLGLRHAATFQPALVMPGLNHASFASGEEKRMPGGPVLDLRPAFDHAAATRQIAEVLADFLVVHRSGDKTGVDAAVNALIKRQVESADIVDPFLTALGRGSPAKALRALEKQPWLPAPDALKSTGMVPGACGGEALLSDETSRRWLAHPGELAVVEAFAERVQRDAVPECFSDRVVVVATAHTDETTFMYNQPTISPLPGDKVLVRAHVYLWRHALETQERIQPAVAPEYALKLRTASAICRALGEDAEAEKQTVSNISGRKVNEATFKEALAIVTSAVRKRYEHGGKKVVCIDDTTDPKVQAPMWVQQQHVSFQDISESETQVASPIVNTQTDGQPVAKVTSYSDGIGRFVGNHYIKVVSLARAVEWLMIDTLRPAKLK